VPVTANAIASRLVENSRYKKLDRQYSISVCKAVNQLTADTHSDVNLCEEVSNTKPEGLVSSKPPHRES